MPIEFIERVRGDSKMSGQVASESLRKITAWGLRERREQVRRALHDRDRRKAEPEEHAMTRRRIPGWLLVVAFVIVPLAEIFVLIQVGQVIGAWWTIALLIADSILGAWVIRREGGRAFAALRSALGSGQMPAKELADGALILIGGTLMLSPGFVTDLFGILLILPFTRPIARRALTGVVTRRLMGAGAAAYVPRPGPASPGNQRRPHPDPGGSVVEGEVVD